MISQTYVDTDNHIRETFGPVAMIEVNQDDRVPMSHVTHSEYGLGASIWTQDLDRARKVASGLRCGSVFVNEITKSDPRLPFGGVGRSGYGRELSDFGLREFTNVKTVWIK